MTTETKSLAAKITKGEAVAEQDGYMFVRRGDRKPLPFNGEGYTPGQPKYDQSQADAALYTEAHNVANETGMTPRQLLERLRAAEKLLRGASDWMHVKRSRMPIAEIDSFLNLPADEH